MLSPEAQATLQKLRESTARKNMQEKSAKSPTPLSPPSSLDLDTQTIGNENKAIIV